MTFPTLNAIHGGRYLHIYLSTWSLCSNIFCTKDARDMCGQGRVNIGHMVASKGAENRHPRNEPLFRYRVGKHADCPSLSSTDALSLFLLNVLGHFRFCISCSRTMASMRYMFTFEPTPEPKHY
mmetsp:Transcript_47881/g.144804  ORF Transcript_47881/g.144804 Transcript_47881/m.144804 type:complete len:124 (-) Transcript_47881:759-1130(-)